MGTAGKGLSSHTVKSMLAEEMGDGDGEVNVHDTTAASATAGPRRPAHRIHHRPPTPPPAAMSVDMQALVTALITGITQGNVEAAKAVRDPIPENKTIAGHSVYSHPDGEAFNTKLRCPMFLGVYDEQGKARAAFEIFEGTCTEADRVELNKLQPGVYPGIERNDGVQVDVARRANAGRQRWPDPVGDCGAADVAVARAASPDAGTAEFSAAVARGTRVR